MRVFWVVVVGWMAGCGTPGTTECLRAVDCVESCGGPVVQSGCDACPKGSFDDISCTSDSGGH